MTDERPPGLEEVESEPKTQGEEQNQRRAQEAREEESRAQEAREKETRAQEEQAREKTKAQDEREEDRKVEAQEGHDGEGEMTTQENCVETRKGMNSMNEENDVSNRHMTWWRNAWWVRMDSGPHLRTARSRRKVWRAATRAARDTCDTERTEEVQKSANSGGEWFSREELLSAGAAVQQQQQQSQPQQQSKQQQLQVLHDLVRCMQTVLEYADRQ